MKKKSAKKEEDYKKEIQQFNWNDLRKLWTAIKAKKTPGWPDGKALEYLILRAFELDGAEVRYPFIIEIDKKTIEQLDGVVHLSLLSCIVECKDYGNEQEPKKEMPVNFEPLAKLRSQLMRRPPQTVGVFFTTSSYTEPAITLARYIAPQTILLWEKGHLDYALRKENICQLLLAKYRNYVETGNAIFDVTILQFKS